MFARELRESGSGIAPTLGREALLIVQSDADVPFYWRHLRFAPHVNNAEGRAALVQALGRRFQEPGYSSDSLTTAAEMASFGL